MVQQQAPDADSQQGELSAPKISSAYSQPIYDDPVHTPGVPGVQCMADRAR